MSSRVANSEGCSSAGFSRISGRLAAIGAYVTGVAGQAPLIEMEPGNLMNVFGTYRLNDTWTVRGNIDNVLDEAYALGAQNAYFVDPSPPRTVSLSVIYKLYPRLRLLRQHASTFPLSRTHCFRGLDPVGRREPPLSEARFV